MILMLADRRWVIVLDGDTHANDTDANRVAVRIEVNNREGRAALILLHFSRKNK